MFGAHGQRLALLPELRLLPAAALQSGLCPPFLFGVAAGLTRHFLSLPRRNVTA